MSKARPYENLGAQSQPVDELEYDIEEYHENDDDHADYDMVYDNGAGYDEEYYGVEPDSLGLFSTPGRALLLIFSVLMLLLVTGTLAWLLGSQRSNSYTTRSIGASSSTNINTSGLQTAVKVGALAPDFALNELYTGKPISLSSLRGKPVWLNFWASWCGPCKAEMPEMKQRFAKYKDKGLVILGVDDAEDNATVKQFTELNGYDWTFVIDGNGSILQQYFVSGIPMHAFIDKNGVIRSMTIGGISGDMMDDGLSKILNQ